MADSGLAEEGGNLQQVAKFTNLYFPKKLEISKLCYWHVFFILLSFFPSLSSDPLFIFHLFLFIPFIPFFPLFLKLKKIAPSPGISHPKWAARKT